MQHQQNDDTRQTDALYMMLIMVISNNSWTMQAIRQVVPD